MDNIILIGLGVAGKIHHNFLTNNKEYSMTVMCYDRFGQNDDKNVEQYEELIALIKKQSGKYILDICSSSDTHIDWIEFGINNSIENIIVEKPLATNKEDLIRLRSLINYSKTNIIVVYNYLHSPVFSAIKYFIEQNQINILEINTNFSKNRSEHSNSKRGADKHGKLPHNYLIELPHQISMAVDLLGLVNQPLECWVKAMKLNGGIQKDHGEGFIKLEHINGYISNHYSDLASQEYKRSIEVLLDNDYRIVGNFGIGPDYLGNVKIWKEDKLIQKFDYCDKSIDIFLAEAIRFINNKRSNPCSVESAILFNEILLECIEKANVLD